MVYSPGFFLNEQNRFLLTNHRRAHGPGEQHHRAYPMRRFREPEDLLGTVLWLLSPASAFVTGIMVPVDSGFSALCGV
jgi:NAD(P)-dependent dehydrogenase (short-subunit alcohol dehydrogenase family)